MGGKGKRLRDNFLVVIIVATLCVTFGYVVGNLIGGWLDISISAPVGTILAVLLYMLIARVEIIGRCFTGYRADSLWLLLWGFCAGVLYYILTLVVCVWKGVLGSDVTTYPLITVFILFCSALLTALVQELVCRGFIYYFLLDRYDSIIAILFNTLFFVAMAVPYTTFIGSATAVVTSVYALNLFLFGLAMTFAVHYRGSIWFAFAFHTTWLFTGNFLPDVMYNYITSIMLAVLCLILYLRGRGIKVKF